MLSKPGSYRYKSKKKAFANYAKKYTEGKGGIEAELEQLKNHCCVIRVLAHTQIRAIGYGQKKAHLAEIQVRRAANASPSLQGSHKHQIHSNPGILSSWPLKAACFPNYLDVS